MITKNESNRIVSNPSSHITSMEKDKVIVGPFFIRAIHIMFVEGKNLVVLQDTLKKAENIKLLEILKSTLLKNQQIETSQTAMLINSRSDKEVIGISDDLGQNILHLAMGDKDIFKLCCDEISSIVLSNLILQQDIEGDTVFHQLIEFNRVDSLEILLSKLRENNQTKIIEQAMLIKNNVGKTVYDMKDMCNQNILHFAMTNKDNFSACCIAAQKDNVLTSLLVQVDTDGDNVIDHLIAFNRRDSFEVLSLMSRNNTSLSSVIEEYFKVKGEKIKLIDKELMHNRNQIESDSLPIHSQRNNHVMYESQRNRSGLFSKIKKDTSSKNKLTEENLQLNNKEIKQEQKNTKVKTEFRVIKEYYQLKVISDGEHVDLERKLSSRQ